MTSLFLIGTVFVTWSMEGGSAFGQSLLLLGVAAGINALFAGVYLVHNGMVRVVYRHRYLTYMPEMARNTHKLRFFEEEQLRRVLGFQRRRLLWLWIRDAVGDRFVPKYRRQVYLPGSGALHRRYLAYVSIAFAGEVGQDYCAVLLVHRHMPLSIAVFLGWASDCWLALWWGRKLFSDFRWAHLCVPVTGLFQLIGVTFAAGLLSEDGLEPEMFRNWIVPYLLANSVLNAWLATHFRETRKREEQFPHANHSCAGSEPRRDGVVE